MSHILGGYELLSSIGQGGMGEVWRARGPDGSIVAFKVLHSHLARLPEFVKRFEREAKLAEKLAHPNVVRVLASGVDAATGRPWLAMELVEGETLLERLERAGIAAAPAKSSKRESRESSESIESTPSTPSLPPVRNLPIPEVIRIMRQVAGVLQAAADIGLVHRDLKPQNILIDPAGNAKLLDFGLAKDTAALHSMLSLTGQTIGTPPYMSPEQHEGAKDVDGRGDLYSLGATAYHMLAGRPPFSGPTASAYARQHCEQVPAALAKINPAVPRNLSEVVERLLAKRPADRHQTPAELIEDLNRVERGEVPLKRYRPRKSRKGPSPLAIAALVGAGALLTLGAVAGALRYREGRRVANVQVTIDEAVAKARQAADLANWDDAMRRLDGVIAAYAASPHSNTLAAARSVRDEIHQRRLAVADEAARRQTTQRQEEAAAAEQKRLRDFRQALEGAAPPADEDALDACVASIAKARDLARTPAEEAQVAAARTALEPALAKRREWAAVVDFTISPSVRDKSVTGDAVAVKLQQAVSDRFRLVTRNQIVKSLQELRFQSSDLVDKAKASQFGKSVGAKWLISGDVIQLGDKLTIAAQVFHVETQAIRQQAEVEARDAGDFNAQFAELARILAMTEAEKRIYLDEQRNYPRWLAEGKTHLAGDRFAEAVKAFETAQRAKATPEVDLLLGQAKARLAAETDRQTKLAAALKTARAAQAAGQWQDCAARAAEALALDPANTEATALKTAADANLAPTLTVEVTAGGRAVAATLSDGQRTWTTPATLKLTEGHRYDFSIKSIESTQSIVSKIRYAPATFTLTADWRGPRTQRVALVEQKEPNPGEEQTVDLGGDVTLTLCWCPAGTFTMGSPFGEANRDNDETQHRVTLTKGFWIGKYEVTQKQWQQVMGSNPSHFKGSDLPVERVSWDDCQEFVRKINARVTGGGFRLPSEAEWEYACRAGTRGPYAGNLDDLGWYTSNSGNATHDVGQKKPNAWNLYDMHGNVWEWCADWYGEYPSGDVSDPRGAGSGSCRVSRGGGWRIDAGYCRSAFRYRYAPGNRINNLGLRLARSPQ